MILKTIEPQHYGPFALPTMLQVEPDVTVLTGPNDTGKSSLLRLIYRVCEEGNVGLPDESEYNLDKIHERPTPWQADQDFGAQVTFEVNPDSPFKYQFPHPFHGAKEITVKCSIAPNHRSRTVIKGERENQPITGNVPLQKVPHAILLSSASEIRSVIDLTKTTPVEEQFLRLAFGPQYSFDKIRVMSPSVHHRELERAKRRLNDKLKLILPPSMPVSLNLAAPGKIESLSVMLQDAHEGLTPLGYRGSGVRRVVTLLATLMEYDFSKEHFIILIDEPETSLHADSQHFLRNLLEGLAAQPTVQVIYATHSPSMINVMRPHTLRLLSRTTDKEKATSVINNRPFKENYLPIRSSLGLNPADSLLYAPLTIVVEGDTEVVGLQLLLKKLMDKKVTGFEDVEHLLSQTHILDGMGDSFVYMCELAKSQGAKAILFLDGDKKRRLKNSKVAEQLVDIPTVTLDDGKEFEQLVPEDRYFQAIADYLGDASGDITPGAFHAWEASASLRTEMVFTKRLNKWLESKGLSDVVKAAVMRKAIEITDAGSIETHALLQLIEAMRKSLKGL